MKKIVNIFFLLLLPLLSKAQSNWSHVGPISENNISDNGFETSRLCNIAVDPLNGTHLFASGEYAGLWESFDRGDSWIPVDNSITGTNGVSAICFLNSNEILVGDIFPMGKLMVDGETVDRNYSQKVWKYNFTTQTWVVGYGPFANPYVIRSIAVYPGNSSIIFVCTNIGLFRTPDAGLTWTNILSGTYVENIVFIPFGSNYYCYAAGSNLPGNYGHPMGTMMLKESSDAGATFPFDFSTYLVPIPPPNNVISHAQICFNPNDGSTAPGNTQIILSTLASGSSTTGLEYGNQYIVSFKKNLGSSPGSLAGTSSFLTTYAFNAGSSKRMGAAYDPVSNGVWFGGQRLNFFDLGANVSHNSVKQGTHNGLNGVIHDDIHDIQTTTYGGHLEMYVACDGGIGRTRLDSISGYNNIYFTNRNNGLHVNLLNGFSGTDDDPNLYAVGGQDIINFDIFDSSIGKNIHTKTGFPIWENDGALIDKFDKDKIFFDMNSYYPYDLYETSEDGGANFTTFEKSFYLPSTSSSTFESSGTIEGSGTANFKSHLFFQDPYRPGRIFFVKHVGGIYQYVYHPTDPDQSVFVNKIYMGSIEPSGGNFQLSSSCTPAAISFSPQTKNSLYFAVDGTWGPDSRPTIIKYIGNDIDDCWRGHNDAYYTDGSGTHPQWATLTNGLWESYGIPTGSVDIVTIKFSALETSPWDPNVIYVSFYAPNHDGLKVFKYDGSTWTNYSTGIPTDEVVYSMVMDHQSNDALYLSTNKGLYYRDAAGSSWTPYNNGYPKMYSKQMEVNYAENTVRAGTFGRGIWKSNLNCPAGPLTKSGCNNCNSASDYFWEGTTVSIDNSTLNVNKQIVRATEYIEVTPGSNYTLFDPAGTGSNYYQLFIHGCDSGHPNSYRRVTQSSEENAEETQALSNMAFNSAFPILHKKSEEENKEADEPQSVQNINAFPNPSDGKYQLTVPGDEPKDVLVYDKMGKIIFQMLGTTSQTIEIDISNKSKGLYLLKVTSGQRIQTKKLIKE